jgi:uncharacterized protein with ParB-like and HNH nuclease domain
MYANQARVQTIIDGVRQYVVPLFQRPYSWRERHWEVLWTDLAELYEDDRPRNHFIGAVVTMSAPSQPDRVSKYTLIDGQQRLTTILVLLAAIRDRARQAPGTLADKIEDLLLRNRYQEGEDAYKLLPTQPDRPGFFGIMDGRDRPEGSPVSRAYDFFTLKLATTPDLDLDRLHNVIVRQLVLVSVVLDQDDNPYLIFESLNAKGEPLTQADLIRNFIFMHIEKPRQEQVYAAFWRPMQERLGEENLTEFIRHYLMRGGRIVKQGEVYYSLQESVEDRSPEGMVAYLKRLAIASVHYARLLDPSLESSPQIAVRLRRLNRFDVTVIYPFLLNVYLASETGAVTEVEYAELLDVIENFLIRRFVCGVPTHGLSRVFSALYSQATTRAGPLLENVKAILRERNYPRDADFKERFVTCRLYGGSERQAKARIVLERLEESYAHKERPDFASLTIEHVLPQTLTAWWKEHLGPGWEETHEAWLDTPGNLTLTAYNAELSNDDFPTKRTLLAKSHVELNRYFANAREWNDSAIARRGEELAAKALAVWPDFGAPGENGGGEEEESPDVKLLVAQAIAQMGGETGRVGSGRFNHVCLADGRIVNIKHSKKYTKGSSSYYWYGVHHSLFEDMNKAGVTHLVLILASHGFLVVPMNVVRQYLAQAKVSKTEAGTVRHYHVHLTSEPELELYHHGSPTRIPLGLYYAAFAP